MSEHTRSGQCLCGKVKFTIAGGTDTVVACHCDMCLRWAGGPYMALDGDYEVEFEGEENITRFRSSDWAERAFCRTCGSNLFYRLIDSGKIILSPGLLDDQSGLKFTEQVFIDKKPGWYAFANETKNMTGAEVFALYAPKDGDPA